MSNCLLLNQNYEPISVLPMSVVSWQHALKLYFLERVSILETYDNWTVRSEKLEIAVPSVCVTKEYFNYKKNVKFSRSNLYLRDLYHSGCWNAGGNGQNPRLHTAHAGEHYRDIFRHRDCRAHC